MAKWPPPPGESVVVGGKIYTTCHTCRKVVRVNKPILGSKHVCV